MPSCHVGAVNSRCRRSPSTATVECHLVMYSLASAVAVNSRAFASERSSLLCIMKRKLFALLFLEEEEDEEIINYLKKRKRSAPHEIFVTRPSEGYFSLLIKEHLKGDEKKFREFFRLNKDQFYFVLNIVENDLKRVSTNAVKYPITPEEKLALTLRYSNNINILKLLLRK
ncbi:hypothetical protein QE152_g23254 [Popillia japonica]|uniref:Uncharacterized protein n=1 Tax=Popillia japonica TaxID=7064 RepID=A0AAW1KHG9_POPJA